jgi:glutathione S-transferase
MIAMMRALMCATLFVASTHTGYVMLTLFHHPLSLPSRYVRLVFGEYGEEIALVEEKPWVRRPEMAAINPGNTLPMLIAEHDAAIIGSQVIVEYLDETRAPISRAERMFPGDPFSRAEVRRLVEWFTVKMNAEVVQPLVRERVHKPLMPAEEGGGSPDTKAMRVARANLVQHMRFLNWLTGSRNWLAGDGRTYADLAAAAAISTLDYLGEINWANERQSRDWYSRMKSRPAMRGILADRVRGATPASHYADLDF